MIHLNAFTMKKVLVRERGHIKRNDLALSVQSQVKIVKLVYIVGNIQAIAT